MNFLLSSSCKQRKSFASFGGTTQIAMQRERPIAFHALNVEEIVTGKRCFTKNNIPDESEGASFTQWVQVLEGEDLDAAFASISAFESDRSIADAVLGVEESAKLLRYAPRAVPRLLCT